MHQLLPLNPPLQPNLHQSLLQLNLHQSLLQLLQLRPLWSLFQQNQLVLLRPQPLQLLVSLSLPPRLRPRVLLRLQLLRQRGRAASRRCGLAEV